jgi:hypothetical protein
VETRDTHRSDRITCRCVNNGTSGGPPSSDLFRDFFAKPLQSHRGISLAFQLSTEIRNAERPGGLHDETLDHEMDYHGGRGRAPGAAGFGRRKCAAAVNAAAGTAADPAAACAATGAAAAANTDTNTDAAAY